MIQKIFTLLFLGVSLIQGVQSQNITLPDESLVAKSDTGGACTCQPVDVFVTQDAATQDTTDFYLHLHNYFSTQCYPYVRIRIDTGFLYSWNILTTGWTINQINASTLELRAPTFYIKEGIHTPLRIRAISFMEQYDMAVGVYYGAGGINYCERYFSFKDERTLPQSCCLAGYFSGIELVQNGSFSEGNTGFSSQYVFIDAAIPVDPGAYAIPSVKNLFRHNYQWFAVGRSGIPDDKFMAIDIWPNPLWAIWKQQFELLEDSSYNFCFYVDNLAMPKLDFNNAFIQVVATGPDATQFILLTAEIPELPDGWKKLSANWKPNVSGSWTIEIRPLTASVAGCDFALDEISLRQCSAFSSGCDLVVEAHAESSTCDSIVVKALSGNGVAPFEYLWSNGTTLDELNTALGCGVYSFCVTITDSKGCTATDCLTFTAIDTVAPQIVCPDDRIYYTSSQECSLNGALFDPFVSDNCSQPVSIITTTVVNGAPVIVYPSTIFPVGTHTITCKATDFCGNESGNCTYNLFVLDTIKPFLACPGSGTFWGKTDETGLCTYSSGLSALFFDNCSTITQNWTMSGTVNTQGTGNIGVITLPEGDLTVTYTATDASGNTKTCISQISVTCDTCSCSIGALEYQANTETPFVGFECGGESLKANCIPQSTWTLRGKANCIGGVCNPMSAQVEWYIVDPQGLIAASGVALADPEFSISVPTSSFGKFGDYKIFMQMLCGVTLCSCSTIIQSKCGQLEGCEGNFVQNGSFSSGEPSGLDESICLAEFWCSIWIDIPLASTSSGDFYNIANMSVNAENFYPTEQGKVGGMWCRLQQDQLVWREGLMNQLVQILPKGTGEYDLSFKIACGSERFGVPVLSVFGVYAPQGFSATPPWTGNQPLNTELFHVTPVELASYIIPSDCNTTLKELKFTFDASSLPDQGITHIFFTRSDETPLQLGGVYVVLDDVCLRPSTTSQVADTPDGLDQIRVYPVPTEGMLLVELTEAAGNDSKIQVLNANGQVLKHQELGAGERVSQVDLSAFPAGLYLIQVLKAGKPVAVGRVVK